jgi:Kef-type K+ transport system membrane component KefB
MASIFCFCGITAADATLEKDIFLILWSVVMGVVTEITLLLALATLVSVVMKVLKQPLLVGYIITGIVAGPYVLNIVHSPHELEVFSKIGIVFLLFIVGLNLNPKIIGEVGKVSLITGIGQIVFTSLVGFLISLFLGIDRLAALYVAIALTFSSTIIILKLITDKGDLEKLYAKIAIGFLLVQDVVATLILIGAALMKDAGGQGLGQVLLLTGAKGIGLIILLIAVSSWVLPRFTRFMASSSELLFVFSATWALGLAVLLAVSGFSMEIGALVAGVTLAASPWAAEMASRLKPLRDLFVLIFFILLGSQMILADLSTMIVPAVILSLFVLIGNPVIVILLMNWLGYSKKTGFMAGLTVAQISEFSLILAAFGLAAGHISSQVLSLITLVGLITIAGSTYLIIYAEPLFDRFSKILSMLELFKKQPNEADKPIHQAQIFLFGYDRVGADFVEAFMQLKKKYLVIDFNPDSIKRLEAAHIPHLFGDATDLEFLSELPLEQAKLVVSTMPDFISNHLLLRRLQEVDSGAVTVLLAHTLDEAEALYRDGATYVLMPHFLGAAYAAKMIGRLGTKRDNYESERNRHRRFLETRLAIEKA